MILFSSKAHAYLIDSENVGSTWAELLKNDEKCDFYIFVTENAKSLNFSLLKDLTENQKHRINIIECEPGKNSLDFYLSSYLGYLIGLGKHHSYTVVSQDTGFDHVIDYWKRQGLEVVRINTKPEKASQPRQNRTRKNTVQTVKKNENSETRIIPKKETVPPVKNEEKPKQNQRRKNSNTSNNNNASNKNGNTSNKNSNTSNKNNASNANNSSNKNSNASNKNNNTPVNEKKPAVAEAVEENAAQTPQNPKRNQKRNYRSKKNKE